MSRSSIPSNKAAQGGTGGRRLRAPKPNLEELNDCTQLGAATDGQVPAWSDANNRWEPVNPPSFVAISKASYTALKTKDPNVIYLVHN